MKKDSYATIRESKTLRRLFFILLGAIVAGLFFIFRFYFWPFAMAFILYIALWPVHEKILQLTKRRTISATILIIILLLMIVIPFFYLMASLSKQGIQLYHYIQAQIDSGILIKIQKSDIVTSTLRYLNISNAEIMQKVTDIAQKTSGKLFASATTIVSWPFNFSLKFFFMILILFFLFKDGKNLTKMIYAVSPFPDDIEHLVGKRLVQVVKVLLAGNLVIMFLQGLMVGLGFYIIGNDTPLLWASIAAILSLIPVIGTSFIWAPGVLYLMMNGSYIQGIFLGAWCLAWYLLLENLIKPKVFGKKLKFHPILFFFLLLGSLQAFGILGVLIGPILLTLFYSLWEIYKIIYQQNLKANAKSLDDEENEPGDQPKTL